MSVLSAALLLFLVLDPLGNVPIFLAVLKQVDRARQRAIIVRELAIALGILVVFLFAGRYLLALLQISQSSLGIAGGIILFLIAIRMIFSDIEDIFGHSPDGEPFVVPLAVPLIAGPSAMTTVMLLTAREPARWLDWLLALVVAWLASGAILYYSKGLDRVLGLKVLVAIERLMGLVLTTVAVEMFISGIRQAFF
jgi:multiple antibiotic resistance protein